MILNSNNVENLVLENPGLLKKLPHLASLAGQWKLGKFVPALTATAKKAKIDFLNGLSAEDTELIRAHLGLSSLVVERLDYALVKNHVLNIDAAQTTLNELRLEAVDFCIDRKGCSLYVCSWK
jgi:hypothetical protein